MLFKAVGFFAFVALGFSLPSGIHKGCFQAPKNGTWIHGVNATFTRDVATCCVRCESQGFMYAAIFNGTVCFCQNGTAEFNTTTNDQCNLRCQKGPLQSNCGGDAAIILFTSDAPVISNVSVFGYRTVKADGAPLDFMATASYRRGKVMLTKNILSNLSITWKVNGHTRKGIKRHVLTVWSQNDTFTSTFPPGIHTVCVEFSNAVSYASRCSSIKVVGNMSSLRLLSHNGVSVAREKIAFKWMAVGRLNISVEATSFANMHVSLSDSLSTYSLGSDSENSDALPQCLKVWEVTHRFRRKGNISANFTTTNIYGRRTLYLENLFIIQGQIKSASLATKFVPVGSRSRVTVDVKGDSTEAVFYWKIGNRQSWQITEHPFLLVNFPNSFPMFTISVKISNHVSRAEATGAVYVLPKIVGATLNPSSKLVVVGSKIDFHVAVSKTFVHWSTVEMYYWDFGDGTKISDSFPTISYKYGRVGRYLASVHVKNHISAAYSNKASIEVHEPIEKLQVHYRPFLFGEVSNFYCKTSAGSDVEFVWNFGDRTPSQSTKSSYVSHLYNRTGKYVVQVIAKNRISQVKTSIELFVVEFDCQKPEVSILGWKFKEITHSTPLNVHISLNLNCSVSLVPLFSWKVYRSLNGVQTEVNTTLLDLRKSVLRERNLVIPAFVLVPGDYKLHINVTMRGTIIHGSAYSDVRVVATPLKAIINGGSTRLIGQRDGEIVLHASESYDPDAVNTNSNLKFSWECIALLEFTKKYCFKDTAMGLRWNTSEFHFVTSMLQKQADMYIFTVTVIKNGKKNATAVQTLIIKGGSFYRLGIKCSNCGEGELETNRVLKFMGECSGCQYKENLVFQWRLFYNPNVKLFVSIHGKCIKADGSSWDGIDKNKNNETANVTVAPRTSVSSSQPDTSITVSPTHETSSSDGTWREFILCPETSQVFPTHQTTGLDVATSTKPSSTTNKKFGAANTAAGGLGFGLRAFDDSGISRIKRDAGNPSGRASTIPHFVRNFGHGAKLQGMYQGTTAQLTGGTLPPSVVRNSAHNGGMAAALRVQTNPTSQANSRPAFIPKTGPRQVVQGGILSGGRSSGSGFGGGSYVSGGRASGTAFPFTNPGFGSGSRGSAGGSSGGRATGSGGGRNDGSHSGQGCATSAPGNQRNGKGSGFASGTACSGLEEKFGQGSAGSNQTDTKNSGSKTNETSGGSSSFKDNGKYQAVHEQVKLMRRAYHPVVLEKKNTIPSANASMLLLKKDSLIPGQVYLLEFSAFWVNQGTRRLAGQTRLYFTTNRGPSMGSCSITPSEGIEVKTWFTVLCRDWIDKHYPLKYQAKYQSVSKKDQYSIVYEGYSPLFKLMLPAGDRKSNYSLSITIMVSDSDGASVTLCPIHLRVLPRHEDLYLLDEELYNMTHRERNTLQRFQAASNLPGLVGFSSAVAHKLNRLLPVSFISSRFRLRHDIRKRILESIQTFRNVHMDQSHMVVTALRDITGVPSQLLPPTAEMALALVEKLVGVLRRRDLSNNLALNFQIYDALLDVVWQLLESSRFISKSAHTTTGLATLVSRIISAHSVITRLRLESSPVPTDSYVTSKQNMTTKVQRHTNFKQLNLMDAGVKFSINKSALGDTADCLESQTSVFGSNPYNLQEYGGHMVNSKVASLNLANCNKQRSTFRKLKEDLRFSLQVTPSKVVNSKEYSVSWEKVNIHEFNVSQGDLSSALSIRIKVLARTTRTSYSFRILFSFHSQPTSARYDYLIPVVGNEARFFLPAEKLKGAGKYFISANVISRGRLKRKIKVIPHYRYEISVIWTRCLYWDETTKYWSDYGCHPTEDSKSTAVECRCNHLTLFGGSSHLVSTDFKVEKMQHFRRPQDSTVVMAVLLVAVSLYVILSVLCSLKDRQEKIGVVFLPENHSTDQSRYHIFVETGCSKDAGTTARVSIILFGKEGRSASREITCKGLQLFQRGSTCCLFTSFPNMIGDIHKVKIWHNNQGSSPSWYLKRLIVREELTGNIWYFDCNNWLAVNRGFLKTECELKAVYQTSSSPVQVFCNMLLNYHIWLSVVTKPSQSNFTRTERLLLCLTVLMSYMLLTAIWTSLAAAMETRGSGWVPVTAQTYTVSVMVSLVITPFYLALLYLFCNTMPGKFKLKQTSRTYEIMDNEKAKENYGALFYLSVKKRSNELNYNHGPNQMSKDKLSDMRGASPCLDIGCGAYKLSRRWRYFAWIFCALISIISAVLVILRGLSFSHEASILWVQTLLLSLLLNAVILQLFVVFAITVSRYVVRGCQRYGYGNESLYQGTGEQMMQIAQEKSEEMILAARDRARFSRCNKPLRGKKLLKARLDQLKTRKVSTAVREFLLAILCMMFVTTSLMEMKIGEKYATEVKLQELLKQERNGSNLADITTVCDIWKWLKASTPHLLIWSNWFDVLKTGVKENKAWDESTLYTFGPGRLWQIRREQSLWKDGFRSSSCHTNSSEHLSRTNSSGFWASSSIRLSVLLGSSQTSLLSQVEELEQIGWIQSNTWNVFLDFVSYEPEYDILSSVRVQFTVSNWGKIFTQYSISSIAYGYPWKGFSYVVISIQVLLALWALFSLSREFGSFMDKGFRHFRSFWNILEAILVTSITIGAVICGVRQVALYQVSFGMISMDFDDSEIFLDLSSLVKWEKALQLSMATTGFFWILRLLRFLRLFLPLQPSFFLLKLAGRKIQSYLVVLVLTLIMLAHSGTLLANSLIHSYTDLRLTVSTIFSAMVRCSPLGDHNLVFIYTEYPAMMYLFHVVTTLILFSVWRVSAVFFLRNFSRVKRSFKRHTFRLLPAFLSRAKIFFREKPWKILWRRRKERYFPSIPVEYAYNELESQVEEMIFRVDNLFSSLTGSTGYELMDESSYSLEYQSSEFTAQYTDETLSEDSECSDSCLSVDTYYRNRDLYLDLPQDSDTMNFSREDSSSNLYSDNGSHSGGFGSEHLFLPSGYGLTNRLQTFKLFPTGKNARFHHAETGWPRMFNLQSEKTSEKLRNWEVPKQSSVRFSSIVEKQVEGKEGKSQTKHAEENSGKSAEDETDWDSSLPFDSGIQQGTMDLSRPKQTLLRLAWPRSFLSKAKVSPFQPPVVPQTINQLMDQKRRKSTLRNFKVYPTATEEMSDGARVNQAVDERDT